MKDRLILLDALTDLDDDLIIQAEKLRPKRPWTAWVAAAAAVAILLSTAFHWFPDGSSPAILHPDLQFITHPSTSYEHGYVGSPYSEKAPTGMLNQVLSPYRMALTARVAEILPDTYRTVGQQTGEFRLVRMKYVRALNTVYYGRDFYCMVSEDQVAELYIFSTVVLTRMKQYGHSNHVLYNVTQDCLSAIDFPLIGGGSLFVFRHNLLDYSFPGTAEYFVASSNARYHFSEPITLQEFERFIGGSSYGRISKQIHDLYQSDNQDILDALDYVRPFENGIFVPLIDPPEWCYRNDEVLYRRYVNGYPTNEAILISPEGVKKYGQPFAGDDLIDLPDLSSALEKVSQDFDAGLITPGHIQGWEEMEFTSHSIFGWYDKTDEGVCGIIRVSWHYLDRTEKNQPTRICYDDQYFLVEQGSDALRPIEHDELLEMGGGAYHFMPGQYGYNEYGRKSPPYSLSF